jgi:hypothetical protein
MKKYEALYNELISKGVRKDAIRINLIPMDNTYCILNYGNEVEVFYSERGVKFDLKPFSSDDEAIDYFRTWVLSDESVFEDSNEK